MRGKTFLYRKKATTLSPPLERLLKFNNFSLVHFFSFFFPFSFLQMSVVKQQYKICPGSGGSSSSFGRRAGIQSTHNELLTVLSV